MANCQAVFTFLTNVRNRAATPSLAPADIASLQQLQLISYLTADQYAAMRSEVDTISQVSGDIAARAQERARLSQQAEVDSRKTHSILFHLEAKDKRDATVQQEAQEEGAVRAADSDLAAREQGLDSLIARKSLLDTLTPCNGAYVALTALGAKELRDLSFRLYRSSDVDFTVYSAQRRAVDQELNGMADRGAQYVGGLMAPLEKVDRSNLWAVGIGLAKLQPDVAQGERVYLDAYGRIGGLAHNVENQIMAAEILSCLPRGVADAMPALEQLEHDARHDARVPKESSLGVASVLLLGQRADGTFATNELVRFLQMTLSYESAALMAIVNRPDVASKFAALRSTFASWGYQASEDVELASAYLAISELPVEGITTKLAILAKGLGTYLEYPLVAAAILASVPVLEANESLNLLEEAYDIVGRRAMPSSQAELICLAVRMVHGVRTETITGLDSTQVPAPTAAGLGYGGPRPMFMGGFFYGSMIVMHGGYYSTFSGIGGVHPGHVHGGGGGFSG